MMPRPAQDFGLPNVQDLPLLSYERTPFGKAMVRYCLAETGIADPSVQTLLNLLPDPPWMATGATSP